HRARFRTCDCGGDSMVHVGDAAPLCKEIPYSVTPKISLRAIQVGERERMRTLVMLSALAVPLVPPAAPPAADFNPDEVLKVAREVGQKANVPPDKLAAAVERVREQLPALTAGHPVKGVFAYQMNAGTAVKLGSGLVRFKQSTRNFDL